jgi:ATP adenylyltransferase
MPEQRLWAPWRPPSMRGERADEGRIICLAAAARDDVAPFVVHGGERCSAMFNAFAYSSGHPMVAPVRHVGSVEDLDADEPPELMILTQRALRAESRPDGFHLGVHEAEIAGAGFAGRVHRHVVRRCAADSNFAAVTADTRVLPQSLEDTYAALRGRFATATGDAP